MTYTIEIPQSHLVAILQLLESVPAPMKDTWPIHQNLMRQKIEQDEARRASGVQGDSNATLDDAN